MDIDPSTCALHNVAQTRLVEAGGIAFSRVPEAIRSQLNPWAQVRMHHAAMCEIRCVIEGEAIEVDLKALDDQDAVEALVFFGDFDTGRRLRTMGESTTLRVERSWFLTIPGADLAPTAFAPAVCRVVFTQGQPVVLGMRGQCRAPRRAELPALRHLAYGTSITERHNAQPGHLAYAPQLAWRLGADHINLGSAGSAHCEAAIADHIAERDDWDFCTLGLSTNMNGFELAEFRQRVGYLVRRVAEADPARLVVCISLWPKAADLGGEHLSPKNQAEPEAYREVLRRIVSDGGWSNVHLLEGRQLLPHWRGLATDILHPSDYGHALIASNLEREIRRLLARMPHLPQPLPAG